MFTNERAVRQKGTKVTGLQLQWVNSFKEKRGTSANARAEVSPPYAVSNVFLERLIDYSCHPIYMQISYVCLSPCIWSLTVIE